MKTDAKPIQSPMTEQRLLAMQRRLEKKDPIAVMSDQPKVTESIRRRSAHYVNKNGQSTQARSVGHKSKHNASREAKFDEDGEALEVWHPFAALDVYLAAIKGCNGPVSQEGYAALRRFMKERGIR